MPMESEMGQKNSICHRILKTKNNFNLFSFLAGRKGEEGLLRLVTDNVVTYFAGCHLRRHHSAVN